MDERTLTALKESIVKWEKRAAGDRSAGHGAGSCPLCKLFHGEYRTDNMSSCSGCPVYNKTGMTYCHETPYEAYCRDRSNESAKAELDFLKSLLPVEEVREEKEESPGFKWSNLDYLK